MKGEPTDISGDEENEETLRARALKRPNGKPEEQKNPGKEEDIQNPVCDCHDREVEILSCDRIDEELERYAELYDMAPVGYFTLDKDGTILQANPTGAAILGKEGVDPNGQKLRDFVRADSLPSFDNFMKSVFGGTGKKTFETEFFLEKEVPAFVHAKAVTDGKEQCLITVTDITGRKIIEEALRKNEEMFRTIVDKTNDGILIFDTASGKFIYANPAICRILGYTPEEFANMTIPDIHPKESLDFIMEKLERLRSGRSEGAAEIPCRRKDGDVRIMNISATPMTLMERMCMVGIFTDVTDHKKAEDELRESEERFSQVAESAGEWIWEVDADGVYTYASPAVEEILGFTPEEIVGKMHFYDLFVPEEKEAVKDLSFEQFADNKPFRRFVNLNLHRNGSRVVLETSGTPHFDEKGGLVGYRGTDTDITARKRAEDELKESRNMLDAVVHGSPIPTFVIDGSHRIIYWNKALEEYSGKTEDEMAGTKGQWQAFYRKNRPCLADLLVDDNEEEIPKWYGGKYTESKLVGSAYEATDFFPHMGESGVWLHFTAVAIRDGGGKIVGGLETLEDITERMRAEDALRKSEEKYRNLVENISDVIFALDLKGEIKYISPVVEKNYGYRPDEIVGNKFTVFIHPDDLPGVMEGFRERVKGEYRENLFRVKDKAGMEHYVRTTLTPIFDGDTVTGFNYVMTDITERKQANEKLEFERKQLLSLFNSIDEIIYVSDPYTYEILYVNDTFRRIFKKDAVGGICYKELQGFDRPCDFCTNEILLKDKDKPYWWEFHNAVVERDYEIVDRLITWPDGRNVRFELAKDITERKKAEEEERLTRERFETLVKIHEMRDVSDAELSQYVMEAASRITGSTLAFIGTMKPDESAMDIVAWSTSAMNECRVITSPIHFPIDKAGIWADAVRRRRPKIVNDYTAPHPGKKGLPEGHVPITRFVSLPIIEEGKIVMIAAVANKPKDYDEDDVTRLTLLMQGAWAKIQRNRAEEALKESEQKFRDIFENVNDAIEIIEISKDGYPGKYIDLNDIACRMVGYTKEEMMRLSPLDITTENISKPMDELLKELHSTGHIRFETEHRRKDGFVFLVEINAHIVTLTGREVILAVTRDITDRKRAEEAVREANKKLNMLSSITRHDILNMIMVIREYLDMSEETTDEDVIRRYHLKEKSAVDAIQHQIEFTRYYQDIGVEEPGWQNAGEIVGEAEKQLDLDGITVDNSLKGLEIFADPLAGKVFYNLMENSLRHGENVTLIGLSYMETTDGVTITYRDDGVGIGEEEKKKLFRRGVGKNTGLGLFLSREILSITGITIDENGEPGKGVNFEIKVPEGKFRLISSEKRLEKNTGSA